MLMLRRKPGEQVIVNNGQMRVKVISVNNNEVVLGFNAPTHIAINREEVEQQISFMQSAKNIRKQEW